MRCREPALPTLQRGKARRSRAKVLPPDPVWLVTTLGPDVVLCTPNQPHPSWKGHSPAGARAGPLLPACALWWDSERGSWAPWARWLRGESLPWALAATLITLLDFLTPQARHWVGVWGLVKRSEPSVLPGPGVLPELGCPSQDHHGKSRSPENLSPEATWGL